MVQMSPHRSRASLSPFERLEPQWRWGALALVLATVTWAALTPAGHAPTLFWPDGRPMSDKALHAITFASVGCLAGVLVRPALLVLAGLMAFGLGIEILQAVGGAGREGDVRDLMANTVGLAAAGAFVLAMRWTLKRFEFRFA